MTSYEDARNWTGATSRVMKKLSRRTIATWNICNNKKNIKIEEN